MNNHTKNGNGIDHENPQFTKTEIEAVVNLVELMAADIWKVIQIYSEAERKRETDINEYLAKVHTALDIAKTRLIKIKLKEIEGVERKKDYINMMLKAQYDALEGLIDNIDNI